MSMTSAEAKEKSSRADVRIRRSNIRISPVNPGSQRDEAMVFPATDSSVRGVVLSQKRTSRETLLLLSERDRYVSTRHEDTS